MGYIIAGEMQMIGKNQSSTIVHHSLHASISDLLFLPPLLSTACRCGSSIGTPECGAPPFQLYSGPFPFMKSRRGHPELHGSGDL